MGLFFISNWNRRFDRLGRRPKEQEKIIFFFLLGLFKKGKYPFSMKVFLKSSDLRTQLKSIMVTRGKIHTY
jgi:hypothetical protein